MNLEAKIKQLETEFNEKIKTLKAEVRREEEFPQDGDEYYFLTGNGFISQGFWDNDDIVLQSPKLGNIFRTKEQAEFAVEKLKIEAELRKYSKPFKEDDDNCFIQINSSHNNIVVDNDECYQTQGTIYFKNRFEAHDAIETVGEHRIKKYLFGVED